MTTALNHITSSLRQALKRELQQHDYHAVTGYLEEGRTNMAVGYLRDQVAVLEGDGQVDLACTYRELAKELHIQLPYDLSCPKPDCEAA